MATDPGAASWSLLVVRAREREARFRELVAFRSGTCTKVFRRDIVESRSGYLEIGFELPSGGAFRVGDVIVTEAPRFVPAG